MINTGERQVGTSVEDIRRDHRARYEWAANRLAGKRVVDAACGIGYGAKILAGADCTVRAFDRDPEAIAWAQEHFNHDGRITYSEGDLYAVQYPQDADAVVCFEALEHIAKPEEALHRFRQMAPRLIVSVPNEEMFPYKGYVHHVRHYTREQLHELLTLNGWRPVEWWGQEGPESEVEEGVNGRTLVAVCERIDEPIAVPKPDPDEELQAHLIGGVVPERVAIVGMGVSGQQYIVEAASAGYRRRKFDEVWAVTSMAGVIEHDRVFMMDDLAVQKARAEAYPGRNTDGLLDALRNTTAPIYTPRAYDDFPASVEYPLEWVLNRTKNCYFNNTVPYALAFAIALGVRHVHLFGCDYSYDGPQHAYKREKGRACLEYWIALASQAGVMVHIPHTSQLLDANEKLGGEKLYGYHTEWVTIEMGEDGFRVGRAERRPEDIPTPEQIEREYCKDIRLEGQP